MKKHIEKSDLDTEIELCLRTKKSCELSLAAIAEVYEKNNSKLEEILTGNNCKKFSKVKTKLFIQKTARTSGR